MGLADVPVPAAPAGAHLGDEERPLLDGKQARLVRPVLEHATLPEQPRHDAGLVAPTRDASAIRWLRSTAEIESSCTHESRRIAASTSAVEPARERVA